MFDLDYTLLRLTVDPVQVYADVLTDAGWDIKLEDLSAAYGRSWETYLLHGNEFATEREAYLFGATQTLKDIGVDDPDGCIAEKVMKGFDVLDIVEPYEDSIPAINSIRDLGIRVGVATGRWHDPSDDLAATGLATLLDATFYSGRLGAQKHETAYWRRVLDLERVTGAQAVLVDDSADAVETAREVGMAAYRIQRPDSPMAPQAGADLERLDVLPNMLGSI